MFTLPWLGGFFDGEGCVSLIHTPNGKKNGQRTFRLFIVIGQRNAEPLKWVKENFGGYLKRNKAGVYHWAVTGKFLDRFIEAIYPHAQLKRSVLDLALQYRALMHTRPKGRGAAYPPELTEKCLAIREEIRRINALD